MEVQVLKNVTSALDEGKLLNPVSEQKGKF
jgi:hypothetical protein